jgi:phosphomannomutase
MSLIDLIAAARAWIEGDPDPVTVAEMEQLIATEDEAALADRLGDRLHFGTAGLRGEVGAGPNRMNRAAVIQATRGLADHLREQATAGPVVVGYDARISSRRFMEDTVGVLAAAGFSVRYFDVPLPTPLVAYAASRLDAAAAVVVTASHNPPQDNGYKVYAKNGAQIVPPDDVLIASAIDKTGPATLIPRIRWSAVADSDLCGAIDPSSVFAKYIDAMARPRQDRESAPLRIVYTPLHGVGGQYTKSLLESGGHEVIPVLSQFEPDGAFPTVDFPNPEEPGALDEAFAIAQRDGSVDLIIANDPDADRLAVSVPTDAGWQPLTGNQVGVLLAAWCLDGSQERPLVLNSIVSSPMLGELAVARDATWATTLTGFKWIWNAALDLAAAGHQFVMGYEEALGYSVGPAVRDKDGVSTALVFADMAADAKARGLSVTDRLAALFAEIGVWASAQHSVRFEGPGGMEQVGSLLEELATSPPADLDGLRVAGVVDYREGAADRPRYLGATPLIDLDLGEAGRCLIRPSGTEPKLKIYVDLTQAAAGDSSAEILASEGRLRERAATVALAAAAAMGMA